MERSALQAGAIMTDQTHLHHGAHTADEAVLQHHGEHISDAKKKQSSQVSAFVIWLIITLVAGLFVFSYSLALGDPQPSNVPVAVVGTAASEVEQAANVDGRQVVLATSYPSISAATGAVNTQNEYGVVVVEGPNSRLIISSASGPSVARVLEQLAPALAQKLDVPALPLTDLHPMSTRDPNGTVFFYMTLAAVILGFVGMVQSETIATKLRWASEAWWGIARAVCIGLVIVVVAGPVLQMESPPLFPAWIVLAATSWSAGATYAFFRLLVGKRWAMLPTWVLFVLVGDPSSGGAIATPLLPAPFSILGPLMPAGACVELLREITYFPDHFEAGPVIALAAWVVVTTLAWLGLHYRKHGWGAPA